MVSAMLMMAVVVVVLIWLWCCWCDGGSNSGDNGVDT